MTTALTLSPKDPLERVPVQFIFIDVMEPADVISTAAVVVEAVVAGTDPTPANLLDGGPSIAGRSCAQWVRNGIAGASYRLRCTVTTNQGRTLVLRAVLPVRTIS